MTVPNFSFIPVGAHEIHVTEWGDPANPPIVMWHGLARTGRDFDELAQAFAQTHFVICPDSIGRGMSSWSQDPEREYSLVVYAEIAVGVLDHYGMDQVGWIGTSMGGLIGMRLASGPMANRLKWLIVNDIGPEVPQEAIDRILGYANQSVELGTVTEAERVLREVYIPFGPAPDSFWRRMARCSVRRGADGALRLHFDPRIVVQFSASAHELTSWDRFQRITLPTHVIYGRSSDILTGDIVARMAVANPAIKHTEFADCGHAPSLSRREDHALVVDIIAKLTA